MIVAVVGLLQLHGDAHLRARVLDRVVHEIRHDRFELVLVAEHETRPAVGQPFQVGQRFRRQPMARPRERQALRHERAHVDRHVAGAPEPRAELAGPQHLFDGAEQPVAVLQHHAVELLALGLVDLTILQRLQVEPHRRDRRLQLVGDGVDERLVLLVAADLAHQEDGVEHDAGDDEGKDEDADDQQAERSAS